MVPLFQGLGYTIVVIAILNQMYYAIVCGWGFFYIFAGFQSELPWIRCDDGMEWHTPNCYTRELALQCRQDQENTASSFAYTWYNGTCVDMETYCQMHGYSGGEDKNTTVDEVNFQCIKNDPEQNIRKCQYTYYYACIVSYDIFGSCCNL